MSKPTVLKHTVIWRKPHSVDSANRFDDATDKVKMHTGYDNSEKRQLWLAFTTSASGGAGGTLAKTDYRVMINVGEYATIIKAMCDVDEDAALSAMAHELAKRLKARARR